MGNVAQRLRRQAHLLRPSLWRDRRRRRACAIVTEWQEFRRPDFEVMKRLLKEPVIFDGRNLYEPKTMASHGFTYYGMGRGAE